MKKFHKIFQIILITALFACATLCAMACGKEVASYSVAFIDYDGSSIIEEQSVREGASAHAPIKNPEREGFVFTGWDKEYNNVTSDLTVTALYERKYYTVTFYGYEDAVLGDVQSVAYGENAAAPVAPEISGLVFAGWRRDYTEIKENTKIYAEYKEEVKTPHVVSFVDDNGKLIKSEIVEDGLSATAPQINTYKKNCYFSGWSDSLSDIKKDVVLSPVFSTNDNIDGLKIYKKAGEDFKVLLLADIQTVNVKSSSGSALVANSDVKYDVYSDTSAAVYNTVDEMIKSNNPDYIVLMGDNVYSRFDTDNLDAHRELARIIDGYKIPWSIIFGNHDGDVPDAPHISRSDIIEVYGESEYFLFEQEEGAECGDYVVSLIEEGSDKIQTQFVFMYTHYNYGDVTQEQLKWYESKMQKLVDGESLIPSVMFAHIPFQDMYYGMVEKYNDDIALNDGKFSKLEVPDNENGDFGIANGFTYSAEHGLFGFVKRYQSTQSVFFGHNHSNAFSLDVDGVRLTHALKTGYYDQEVSNRDLDGATLLTLKDGGNAYSVAYKFAKDSSKKDIENSYTFTRRLKGEIDNDYLFLDYTSGLGNVSGATKITLKEGESAYIEFDVIDGLRYNTGTDNIQAGFRISANPITASWPSASEKYAYYMINGYYGDKDVCTVYDGVLPLTYSYNNAPDAAVKKQIVESVFKGGKTLKFVVNSDGTYAMYMKNTGEPSSEYAMFRSGPVNIDISNGFYIGFTFNRDITVDNLVITGSEFFSGYNFVGVKPVLNKMGESTKYTVSTNSSYDVPGFIYGTQGKVLANDSDTLETEFTIVQPQSSITSANYSGFCVTTQTDLNAPYTASSSFMLYSNHVYTTVTGTDVSCTIQAYENGFNDYTSVHSETGNPEWKGSMLFRSYVTYKFTVNGAGEYALYMKSALDDNAVYQKVLGGKVTGIDKTVPLYVGYLFFDECELSGVTANGSSDISYHNVVTD